MIERLVIAAIVTVVVLSMLAAATPVIVRLIDALTPLVLVVGTLLIVWRLVRYFTRQ